MTEERPDVEPWFGLADEILAFVTTPPMAGSQMRAPAEYVNAGRLLVFQWGRSIRSFRAILTLVREGFSEDAIVIGRTLLEGLFEMAFIAKHPEAAEMRISHGLRAQAGDCKWARENIEMPPSLAASVGLQEAKALVLDPERTMKPKRSPRSRWHPKFRTIKDRAIEAGVNPLYYDILYSFTSRYVHGSGDWLAELLSPWVQQSRVSYGASSEESALAMMTACMCIVEELRLLDGCLSLELGEALDALENSERRLFERLGSEVLDKHDLRQVSGNER